MDTGRDHPRRFSEGLLSSFRLRSLTAVRTVGNQIVAHVGLADRSRLELVDRALMTRPHEWFGLEPFFADVAVIFAVIGSPSVFGLTAPHGSCIANVDNQIDVSPACRTGAVK